jgi:hypothetical protein
VTAHDGSEPPFTLVFRKRRDWDDSWDADWVPVPRVADLGSFDGWDDMPETEFIYHRFRADVDLVIADRDFSTRANPVLDFALAWQYLPRALDGEDVIETSMSVQGLAYRVERSGDRVLVSSNFHPERRSRKDFHPYTASLARAEFEELVERIVSEAFELLYEAHPQLTGNRYLNDLRARIGR